LVADEKSGGFMKIAVCSTNGKSVDEHFGKSKELYVYDFSGGKAEFVEKRDINKYCQCGSDCMPHDFSPERLESIYLKISDCKKLYTPSMGKTPKEKMEEKGIEVVIYEGEIEAISLL
jgi:predicted Fe-Mo cluster-binding NifX family protein